MSKVLHVAHVLADTPLYNSHLPRMVQSCVRHTAGPLAYHLVVDPAMRDTAFVDKMTAVFSVHGEVVWYYATPPYAATKPSHHKSVLLKLMLPSIIRADVTRLLYLDLDIVCVGSMRDIIGSFERLAPKDASNLRPLGMGHAFNGPDLEFNSGVIVLDLPQLRQLSWSNTVRRIISDKSKLYKMMVGCSTNSVVRNWMPCEAWADQEIWNGLNRANGGRLIARLPCRANVQLVMSLELTRCLNKTSAAPPLVLHSHRSVWKQRLINSSAAAQLKHMRYRGGADATLASVAGNTAGKAGSRTKAARAGTGSRVAKLAARAAAKAKVAVAPRKGHPTAKKSEARAAAMSMRAASARQNSDAELLAARLFWRAASGGASAARVGL